MILAYVARVSVVSGLPPIASPVVEPFLPETHGSIPL